MRKMCAKEYKGQLEGAATDKIWGDLSLKKMQMGNMKSKGGAAGNPSLPKHTN